MHDLIAQYMAKFIWDILSHEGQLAYVARCISFHQPNHNIGQKHKTSPKKSNPLFFLCLLLVYILFKWFEILRQFFSLYKLNFFLIISAFLLLFTKESRFDVTAVNLKMFQKEKMFLHFHIYIFFLFHLTVFLFDF